jgi:hypothetical protein
MEWLVILALNFADGGSQVSHIPVPSRDACRVAIQVSIVAATTVATAPVRYSATCVDLKNAKAVRPSDEPAPPPAADKEPAAAPALKRDRDA